MEYLATLAPKLVIFLAPLMSKGMLPMSTHSSLCCWAAGLGHGTTVRVWFCFNQLRVGGERFCREADCWVELHWPLPIVNVLEMPRRCTHHLHDGWRHEQNLQQTLRVDAFIQMSNHLCNERNLIIFCYCVFVVWVHVMTGSACWACWGRGNSIQLLSVYCYRNQIAGCLKHCQGSVEGNCSIQPS